MFTRLLTRVKNSQKTLSVKMILYLLINVIRYGHYSMVATVKGAASNQVK